MRRSRRACGCGGCPPSARRRRPSGWSGCAWTRTASPSRPASSRSWPPTASCSPSVRTSTVPCGQLDGVEVVDGVVRSGRDMMTGRPGVFAGGDIVPAGAHRHRRRRPRQAGRPRTSTPGCAARCLAPAPQPELAAADTPAPVVLLRRPATLRPQLDAARRVVDLRRGRARPGRGHRALRGAPLPVLRQLFRVRQLLRDVPRQRRHQARCRASATRST